MRTRRGGQRGIGCLPEPSGAVSAVSMVRRETGRLGADVSAMRDAPTCTRAGGEIRMRQLQVWSRGVAESEQGRGLLWSSFLAPLCRICQVYEVHKDMDHLHLTLAFSETSSQHYAGPSLSHHVHDTDSHRGVRAEPNPSPVFVLCIRTPNLPLPWNSRVETALRGPSSDGA